MSKFTKTQRKMIRAFEEYRTETGIGFSYDMSAKMSGMLSLSTSPHGERCKANAERFEVCKHCYAKATDSRYPALHNKLMTNARVLQTTEIAPEKWIHIDWNSWRFVRLESFGDVNNITQVLNYFALCEANPHITFTVWTKNIDLYYAAIQNGNPKPKNLIIIFSSPMLNTEIRIPERYKGIIDKVFTVYTAEWLIENGKTPCFINCGARSCKRCQKCYHADNGIVYVREILKSDVRKVHKHWESQGWTGCATENPRVKGINQ